MKKEGATRGKKSIIIGVAGGCLFLICSGALAAAGVGIFASTRPTKYLSVSPGSYHTCAAMKAGGIECWGSGEHGQVSPPDGMFTKVSSGHDHTCAIREDGSITCWGNNEFGQLDTPAGVFTDIDVGGSHDCGIREDGHVTCWGATGELPEGLQDDYFADIDAGDTGTCGVLALSGSIVCWTPWDLHGANSPPQGDFKAVSSGHYHSCGLHHDGTVECWGCKKAGGKIDLDPDYGQCSPPDGVFTSLSAGAWHTCGIREDSSVDCWGWLLASEESLPEGPFVEITSNNSYVNIACGLRENGTIACWGMGCDRGTGDPSPCPP